MNCFEETAQVKQPFAAVDSPPVLPYDEIESGLDENLDDHARPFAKPIYEHWKTRRLEAGNKSVTTGLKVMPPPFVTCRAADHDPVRNRGRHRRCRSLRLLPTTRSPSNTEDARERRPQCRETQEAQERARRGPRAHGYDQTARSHETRTACGGTTTIRTADQFKTLKAESARATQRRRRGSLDQSKGNEQLDELCRDRVPDVHEQKKKPLEITQRPSGNQLRLPSRSDGRPTEAELYSLSDILADQERQIQDEIEQKIAQHQQWNQGYVDMTKAPLTPPPDVGAGSTFRTATTEYLPTPPASISSDQSCDAAANLTAMDLNKGDSVAVRYASPSYDGPCHSQPSFRRRYGRGGRLLIDRRGKRTPAQEEVGVLMADRFKYDDDEDEDETPTYFVDQFDSDCMHYRARLFQPPPNQAQLQASRRAQIEGPAPNSQGSGAPASTAPRRPSGD